MRAISDRKCRAFGVVAALMCAVLLLFASSAAHADSFLPEVEFDTSHHASYDVMLNTNSEGIDDKIAEALEDEAATEVKTSRYTLKFVNFNTIFDYFSLGDITYVRSNDNRVIGNFWCWITGQHQYETSKVEPTCTTYGYEWGVCQSCDRIEFRPIPALGHKWGNPIWAWADDPVSATATFTCEHDAAHQRVLPAEIAQITLEDGSVTYIATVMFENTSYTDNHVPEIVGPKPHEHDWNAPVWEWAEDSTEATASFICKVDANHKEVVPAEITRVEEGEGKVKRIATVTFEGKTFTDERIVEEDVDPDDPSKPVDPDDPNKPTDPDDPSQPDDPTGEPDDPIGPVNPNPGEPNEPDTPSPGEDDDPSGDDDPSDEDPVIIGSDPVVVPVGSDGKVGIQLEGVPGEFVLSIDGAPQGNLSFAVRKVTAGPVYEALTSAVAEATAGHEITGIFDIDLTVNGQQKSEDFGSLTLSFPVSSNHNNRWATVFHCHNNDTDNISSYDSVLARDGKVSVKGVKNLSTFAVAVGDRAVAKQIGQVNLKTRITKGLVQPVQTEVKRPQMVSESETLTHSVAGPVEAVASGDGALPGSGSGADARTAGQPGGISHQSIVIGVGAAIVALMTLLVVLIIFAKRREEE